MAGFNMTLLKNSAIKFFHINGHVVYASGPLSLITGHYLFHSIIMYENVI